VELLIFSRLEQTPGMTLQELARSVKKPVDNHMLKATLESAITAEWISVTYSRAAYRYSLTPAGHEHFKDICA
jgi:DNA-binding HxlR family transcriptional regulator